MSGRDAKGRFLPGHGGRRPRGSHPIGPVDFCNALQAEWREHGAGCIERLCREDPVRFLMILIPIVTRRWGRKRR